MQIDMTGKGTPSLADRKWIILLTSVILTMVDMGVMFSLGAMFDELLGHFKTNRSSVALIQSLCIFMTVLSGLIGLLISQFGLKKVSFVGSVLTSVGLGSSFFVTSVWHLYITISITAGIGISFMFICNSAILGYAFDGRAMFNVLAMQLSSISVGAATYSYLIRYLTLMYGVNGVFLILSGICLNNFVAVILYPGPEKAKVTHDTLLGPILKSSDGPLNLNRIVIKDERRCFQQTIWRLYNFVKQELSVLKSLPYFFTMIAATLGQAMADGITNVYIDLYLWKNYTEDQAVGSFLIYQACTFTMRLLCGAFMQIKWMNSFALTTFTTLCGCLGVSTIYLSKHYAVANFGMGFLGMSAAGFVAGSGIIVAELVPKEKFGFAFGLVLSSIAVVSVSIGPLFGYVRDCTQSYAKVFLLLGVSYLAAACLFLTALIYRRWRRKRAVSREFSK